MQVRAANIWVIRATLREVARRADAANSQAPRSINGRLELASPTGEPRPDCNRRPNAVTRGLPTRPVKFLDDTYEDKNAISYGWPLCGSDVALPSGLICAGRAKEIECGIGLDQSAGKVL